jgi:Astacin (Peptidase family M12A)
LANAIFTDVRVIKGSGCYSYIGRTGGVQDLGIGSGCSTGNTIHEIGHAVGLYHEHTRPDRNSYVIVNTANIQASLWYNCSVTPYLSS